MVPEIGGLEYFTKYPSSPSLGTKLDEFQKRLHDLALGSAFFKRGYIIFMIWHWAVHWALGRLVRVI